MAADRFTGTGGHKDRLTTRAVNTGTAAMASSNLSLQLARGPVKAFTKARSCNQQNPGHGSAIVSDVLDLGRSPLRQGNDWDTIGIHSNHSNHSSMTMQAVPCPHWRQAWSVPHVHPITDWVRDGLGQALQDPARIQHREGSDQQPCGQRTNMFPRIDPIQR